jgi:translation initiation factor 1
VIVSRETKGRKGAGVTLIRGLPLTDKDLAALAKKLKARCGVGGSVKDGVIELQGEQRDRVVELLEAEGYRTKKSGG